MFLSTMDTENIPPAISYSKVPRFTVNNIAIHKTECRWLISTKSFASKSHGEALTSPKMQSVHKDGPSFQFKLYPHGDGAVNDGYSSVVLQCLDETKQKFIAWAYVKVFNYENDEKSVECRIDKKYATDPNKWGDKLFLHRDEILKEDAGFVDGGFFVVKCEIKYKKLPKYFQSDDA